mmetsp:Transcript_60955/g.176409  ORF Transcript_60955/g.176409 Transcript_60955/m.176409 type:complete len:283 (+) Transcript_60955:173-1021(+)
MQATRPRTRIIGDGIQLSGSLSGERSCIISAICWRCAMVSPARLSMRSSRFSWLESGNSQPMPAEAPIRHIEGRSSSQSAKWALFREAGVPFVVDGHPRESWSLRVGDSSEGRDTGAAGSSGRSSSTTGDGGGAAGHAAGEASGERRVSDDGEGREVCREFAGDVSLASDSDLEDHTLPEGTAMLARPRALRESKVKPSKVSARRWLPLRSSTPGPASERALRCADLPGPAAISRVGHWISRALNCVVWTGAAAALPRRPLLPPMSNGAMAREAAAPAAASQ